MKIDLNADLGESFGIYRLGQDDELLKVVSSANIACGFHAGDYTTIRKVIKLAKQHNVAVGAHPGYQDLQGFGRRKIDLTPSEIYDLVIYQLGAFHGFAKVEGVDVQHVKPHGALYNLASVDERVAEAIASAVYDFNSNIKLYGLCNSLLVEAGEAIGLTTIREAFADRTYTSEGLLMSRSESNAVKQLEHEIVEQVINIVTEGRVWSNEGKWIPLEADTICLHGDSYKAVEHARLIRKALLEQGILIKSFQ
ncbi:LamB/YcsF family protein [Piscibacillus sp. B03]|uniref:LamB/YcsF family protein n=1 Tax=Piscibacillus sp. B03 TaxID=3457430 RepID=UPI003FCC2C15